MTYPAFNSGDILTATDMNAVGMWKITSVNLSGTSTVISNCFSSNYDNYRIVVSGIGANAESAVLIQMTNSGSAPTQVWAWAYRGLYANGTSADVNLTPSSYAETGSYIGIANTPISSISMDLFNPNKTQRTFMVANSYSFAGSFFFTRNGGGVCDNNTAYDGFRLYTSAGATFNSGIVTVYGYQK